MERNNLSLEIRIFICFILTIFYVSYVVESNKASPSKALEGFEVRIINDHTNERLELTETLGTWKDTIYTSVSLKESEKYLNDHKATHTDLVIYDLKTDAEVASSD